MFFLIFCQLSEDVYYYSSSYDVDKEKIIPSTPSQQSTPTRKKPAIISDNQPQEKPISLTPNKPIRYLSLADDDADFLSEDISNNNNSSNNTNSTSVSSRKRLRKNEGEKENTSWIARKAVPLPHESTHSNIPSAISAITQLQSSPSHTKQANSNSKSLPKNKIPSDEETQEGLQVIGQEKAQQDKGDNTPSFEVQIAVDSYDGADLFDPSIFEKSPNPTPSSK